MGDRCGWCGDDPLYVEYHDHEWGRPVAEDARLFEKVCLEGFQSGLSWITILRKREAFRRAFADFDPVRVSRFNRRSVDRLLADASIVRHRGKIESAIQNAKRALELMDEHGSLGAFFWKFEPEDRSGTVTPEWVRANPTTPESTAMARELKRRGWTFVGPTTCYAFMQALGMVNDHVEGCPTRSEVERMRARFSRPSR
ncbi:MAG: DNA-3-methyladenine glycosylase I [Planctomycetota bacterium]